MTPTTEEDARRASRRLAEVLLGSAGGIAERAVARMQARLPSYAKLPAAELVPATLANTRTVLEVIGDPGRDPAEALEIFRASGDTRARQGITSYEILHGWSIGLEALRESAYAVGHELRTPPEALLAFVEDTLHWGDTAMRASAWAHREIQVRELGRLYEQQAALRRVTTLVAQGTSLERLLASVAEQVAGVLRVPLIRIVSYGDDGTATERVSRSDRREKAAARADRPARQGGVLERVRTSGRPARIEDAAAAPIVVAGRIWGAIGVSSAPPEPLPGDVESRLMDFSELVAMAIWNANAREEVERLADEQAALRRIAILVAQWAAPETVFSAVSQEVSRLFDTDLVVVGQFDPVAPAYVVVGVATSLEGISAGSRWELDDWMSAAVVHRTGRSARRDDGPGSSVTEPLGVPGDRREVVSSVSSPIVVEGRLWGAITLAATERLPGQTAGRLEKFTDLIATGIANADSREALRQLADGQAALRRVAMLVARGSRAEEVFAAVAEEVGTLLDAEAGAIERFEPDGYYTVVGSWGKLRDAFATGSRWRLGLDSVSATVHRTRGPVRLQSFAHAAGAIAAKAHQVGLRSAVGSPIVVEGRVWGALVVATVRPQPLPGDAEPRLTQFAELVATAIGNVEARSHLAASRARVVAASDEERRRVVRDLREGAQQRLMHTIVTAKLAGRALQHDRADAIALVAEALEHAQTANDELRELAHGILPSTLINGGLGAGLRGLASRMPIPVRIEVPVDRLPPTVEATAYFVIAKALTNVARASDAHEATVSAHLKDRILQIEVRDDAISPARIDGPGLLELRDRLAALDGRVHVDPSARRPSVITASIPVG
jgi:signal transduction histidine kinase